MLWLLLRSLLLLLLLILWLMLRSLLLVLVLLMLLPAIARRRSLLPHRWLV